MKGESAANIQQRSQGKKELNFTLLFVPLTAKADHELGVKGASQHLYGVSFLGHRARQS